MAGRGRQTASHAAGALRKPGTTEATRSVAAGALSQAPHDTSPRVARIMRRSGATAVTRSVAARALEQAANRRESK